MVSLILTILLGIISHWWARWAAITVTVRHGMVCTGCVWHGSPSFFSPYEELVTSASAVFESLTLLWPTALVIRHDSSVPQRRRIWIWIYICGCISLEPEVRSSSQEVQGQESGSEDMREN